MVLSEIHAAKSCMLTVVIIVQTTIISAATVHALLLSQITVSPEV